MTIEKFAKHITSHGSVYSRADISAILYIAVSVVPTRTDSVGTGLIASDSKFRAATTSAACPEATDTKKRINLKISVNQKQKIYYL